MTSSWKFSVFELVSFKNRLWTNCFDRVARVAQLDFLEQELFYLHLHLHFRAKFLERQTDFERAISQNTNTDLAFMIDCTGSMAPYIGETKSQIAKIVETCVAEFDNKVISTFYYLIALKCSQTFAYYHFQTTATCKLQPAYLSPAQLKFQWAPLNGITVNSIIWFMGSNWPRLN